MASAIAAFLCGVAGSALLGSSLLPDPRRLLHSGFTRSIAMVGLSLIVVAVGTLLGF